MIHLRGYLKRLFVVKCGRCETVLELDWEKKTSAEWWLRQKGWSKTGRLGWVCPACKQALKKGTSPNE